MAGKPERITDETTVSTTELAMVLGLSARRIQQMAQDGTIIAAQRGRFPLCDAVQRYINFLSKDDVSEEDLKVDKVKRTADASLRSTKAKIAQLELQELQGKMHSSDDVEAITSDLIFAIRGALIALPGRLAVDAAKVETPAEAAELIRKEVHKIMRELANYQYDPQKYEERVRARKDWETSGRDVDDD
nr:hypothetical protein [uncultured Agathobaculum sp.]